MANWSWVGKIHRNLYRVSGGRIGARLAGMDMLLLTTTGRKSGEPRTQPLATFPDGGDWVVVGSNNGQDHHPAWYLNLQANPDVRIQVGREERAARAVIADEAERARLWPWLQEQNPQYAVYEGRTDRQIPVVILRPES